MRIYLDDIRIPVDPEWILVKSYDEFVEMVQKVGLQNIDMISLDHDLGEEAMHEYYTNVSPNFELNYGNINEKTGYDAAKWLVNHFYELYPERIDWPREKLRKNPPKFPSITVHSANPIGSANIIGYINNFLMNEAQAQTCERAHWEHKVEE